MNSVRAVRRSFILLTLAFVVFGGCAEVQPPPGGEVDKTGPTVLRTEPVNGSVNVGRGNTVTIYFSKDVNEPLGTKGVFISPRPSKNAKIKWRSDHLVITLPDTFKTNQTYLISVTAGLTDLRGNKMDSSLTVAFSTGPALDSGTVAGHVYQEGMPQIGTTIALYDLANFKDTIPYDSTYPDYMTQSGKAGYFSFLHLPYKEFRLIAFTDKNRSERFNPLREPYAVPDRPVKVGQGYFGDLNLGLTTYDTTKPEIISATYTSDRIVRLRLSRLVPLEYVTSRSDAFRIRSHADTTAFPLQGIAQAGEEQTQMIDAYFGDLPDGLYRIALTYDTTRPALKFDSLKVAAVPDKVPPTIVTFVPGAAAPLFVRDVKMRMTFSEPIDTSKIKDQTFLLLQGKDSLIGVTRQWEDPFHLLFKPDKLYSGASYRLQVTEFDVLDHAGNRLGDTLREYKFQTLNTDSLGTISGDLAVDLPGKTDNPVVMAFDNVVKKQKFNLTVTGTRFTIDVPAGKYLLSGFIDSDRNGKRNLGSIFPYFPCETAADYPDTVVVRARFETTGIKFEFK
ncbi:MAG TPA: Ig-like domain-containing protein [Candidatus Acidoferrum sp.]|nr:Ig-like domain-containing protein [Candidatus Acidoferrum sp.]